MTNEESCLTFKRVLVTFDASPQGLALLEMAGELAACFGSSLAGVFLEDRRVRDFAALPTAQEVSLGSASLRGLDMERAVAHQRAQLSLARRALDSIARARRLPSKFLVHHDVDDMALAMAEAEDLVMVCPRIGPRPGRQTHDLLQTLLGGAASGILTLDAVRRLSRPAPVAVILGKSSKADRAALAISRTLAGHLAAPMLLFAPRSLPALEKLAAHLVGPETTRSDVRLRPLRPDEPYATRVCVEGPSLAVLMANGADGEIQKLLGQGLPLLVLRRGDPSPIEG